MYDTADKVEQAYGTWRELLKQGKTQEAQDFATKNTSLLSKYRGITGFKRAETALNQQILAVERSTTLSPAEKRLQLRALRDQKDKIAQRAPVVVE